ncbi:hypothetical protein B296_00001263 [Ensete ventricosum]|uniref:Uncharacterized protein n=1 Tax=Ensete ventricosum TaxID=4639 RepID=A0A427AQ61_ENSVE|nr:hypothetical protein B296_00001263 [Ensete ventricosum]
MLSIRFASLRVSALPSGRWKKKRSRGIVPAILQPNRMVRLVAPWPVPFSANQDSAPLDYDPSRELLGIDVDPQPRPVCASSPVVISMEKRWSIVEWWELSGAFIVKATRHSYLRSLLSLLLTMPSYFVVAFVVLTARHTSCFLQLGRVDLAHLTRVSVRVISSPGSGEAGLGDLEASPSGASSGPLSLVDARVLRDLEVMKVDHDLDTAVTEGSLAVIKERYSISAEYGLHVPRSGQRPYSSDAPGVCISVDALEADRMDLGDLRGMLKMSGEKAPVARSAASTQRIGGVPPTEVPKSSSKRPFGSPVPSDDPSRRHKKVKILSRRHKSRRGEEGSRSHSKGKEPAEPVEEPETLRDSAEEDASPVFHRSRSMKDLFKTKVHKDNVGYYALHMSDLAHQDPEKEMQPRWEGLKNSIKVWNDPSVAEEFKRGLLHSQLAQELYTLPSEVLLARATNVMVLMALFDRVHDADLLITFMDYRISHLQQEIDALKSGGGPEAVAKAEERAFELEKELEKTKRERDEALQRLEASDRELNEVRSNLSEIQRLPKEARVRARKMDDELLQSVKALENARAELPRQAVDHYKESAGFKEVLKRMGRVTYEYGYRVALARFRSLHPDSEVQEDPFTIRLEDDSVPMERQQAFDDSDPPES